MYRLPVKSNLVDSGSDTTKKGFGDNNQPLCPKPRRLGPALPEFLKPFRCSKHWYELVHECITILLLYHYSNLIWIVFIVSQPITDERSGILSLVADKVST
jgi:hypothetical protein